MANCFAQNQRELQQSFTNALLPRGKNALRTRNCTREQLPKWLIVAGSQLRGEISTICEAKKNAAEKSSLTAERAFKKVLYIQHREQQEIVDSAHNARVTEWFTRAIGHSHLELLYDCVLRGVFRLRNRVKVVTDTKPPYIFKLGAKELTKSHEVFNPS